MVVKSLTDSYRKQWSLMKETEPERQNTTERLAFTRLFRNSQVGMLYGVYEGTHMNMRQCKRWCLVTLYHIIVAY